MTFPAGPRARPATLALAAALLAVAAGPAAGAQPQEEGAAAVFGERIEVGLVDVDVWVTDAEGAPVHGLGAEDFTLLHYGEPVEVSHFSEVRSGGLVASVPPADGGDAEEPASGMESVPEAAPGHLIVYFDQLRLSPSSYGAVGEALDRVLADAGVPAERILVLRQDQGLHLEVPFGAGARFEARQRQGARSGMSLLAAETGGRAVFNRGDLAPELAAISREMGDHYSLAFPPPAGSGPVHRVEVTVDEPGLTVRHRRAVRPPDAEERIDEGLAGALHLAITRNPHDLSLGLAGAGAEAGAPLSLLVMVPLDRLVFAAAEGGAGGDGSGEKLARVELRALAQATGAPGEPVPLSQEYRLRQPAGAGGGVASQRANLPLPLPLPPGPHRLAVALRDLASGETSFVSTALTVPSPPD